jgi:DNA-binding response OmpR family regulator
MPAVLVVDDDVDARRMYAEFLRAQGCVVFLATDGKSAIEKSQTLAPDLVVLDLAMPRVDGWTVLRRLRESSWTAHVPIVVVSALTDARDASLELGCDAYLAKPCAPDVLWMQIQRLLHLRRL